jgi:hypothetical protein
LALARCASCSFVRSRTAPCSIFPRNDRGIEVDKLAVREQALRGDLAAGPIADDDPRWLDNRPVSRLYAREGRD